MASLRPFGANWIGSPRNDGVSRSDVLRRSLQDFLFVRPVPTLQRRMMAAAQAQGIYTNEDVFTRIS